MFFLRLFLARSDVPTGVRTVGRCTVQGIGYRSYRATYGSCARNALSCFERRKPKLAHHLQVV